MVKTIGNPLSWTVQQLAAAGGYIAHSTERVGTHTPAALPEIREIGIADIRAALRLGWQDFAAVRADVIFICVLYPVIGLILATVGLHADLLHLLFPLASGFALIGPLAAVGLYEISRRREAGQPATWGSALGVIASPSFPAIIVLGLYLVALFAAWLGAAYVIYGLTLGPEPPASVAAFLTETFTTAAGWAMIVIGVGVGFGFALVALSISLVSFPLLLDRPVGVPGAIVTSWRVMRRNPRTALTWGAIVAGSLVIGSLPFLIGLVVVLPVLGHATWHLYRRAVAR